MKKNFILFISIISIILITSSLFLVACHTHKQEIDNSKNLLDIDYSQVLKDYENAPSSTVAASVKYDIASILEDSTKSNAYKAAATVLFTTANETFSMQYAYFKNQYGTTNIDGKEGTLIYQRTRLESTVIPMKYDTTLKLPVNHNFGSTETGFVTDAAIRYVNGGLYHRFASDSGDPKYDEKTGLLSVDSWKKQSSKNWHRADDLNYGYGAYTGYDQKKIQLDVGDIQNSVETSTVKDSLINENSVKITKKDGYYIVYFEANVEAANKDKNTTNALNNDNSGKNMQYEYLKVTIEVWDCGLLKTYCVEEKWTGKIGAAVLWYEGSASANTKIVYSYSDDDCLNFKYAQDLTKELCSDCK